MEIETLHMHIDTVCIDVQTDSGASTGKEEFCFQNHGREAKTVRENCAIQRSAIKAINNSLSATR